MNDNSLLDAVNGINWDFPDSVTENTIHSIHPYPAKFIPEIPHALIDIVGLPTGTWVLDPFCGSGVTLVEAQLAGIPSIGIDLNPIACLISRVKTQPLNGSLAFTAVELALRAQSTPTVPIPLIPNLNHWYQRGIQDAIARLLVQIDKVDEESLRDALRLALSSILVRVSNQESDTRYAAIQKNSTPEKVYSLFLAAAERIDFLKRAYKPKTWEADILCRNTLKVCKDDLNRPIGLVITSPPYPNAYEYWLYHKYRMFWLGYDPINVKEQEIGARAHYFKKDRPTERDFQLQMSKVLQLIWATMVPGGHVCIIIGRSKIHGKIVDNAAIITAAAVTLGYEPVVNIARTIAASRKTFNLSHASIHTENLLVFRKP